MARPYKRLRGEMYAHDVDQQAISCKIGKSVCYVSDRMRGKRPWTIDDAYQICDALEIPHDQLHEFFPPTGAKS